MDVINALISPIALGIALAPALWWTRKTRARGVWRTGVALAVVCILLCTPLVANLLVRWQEQRVAGTEACAAPPPDTVVLLTAGARRVARVAADAQALNLAGLRRTLGAARLIQQQPGAALVVTGTSDRNEVAVSTVMAAFAEQLGVPAAAVRVETAARTTWQNARNVRALRPALPARIWLVTSALHLPRALFAFRAAGFDPCGYAADALSVPFDGGLDLIPGAAAAANSEAVLHEWIGEVVYRLRARFGD